MPRIHLPSALCLLLLPVSCGDDGGDPTSDTGGTTGSGTSAPPTTTMSTSAADDSGSGGAGSSGGEDSTSGSPTSGETSTDGDETTGSVAGEPHAAGGPLAPMEGYEGSPATGFALLVRTEAGTDVSLQVSGLDPSTDYPAHVHVQACDDGAAGGHYKIDPSIDDTVPENEIWPAFTTDENGVGRALVATDHIAREEAVSIVVHDPAAMGTKMLCADLLVSSPLDPFVTGGPATVLQAAIDAGYDELAADATMERAVDGGTTVSLSVSGLGADQMYGVHVHDQACAASSGGGHYKIDYGITDTQEANELWLPVSTDAAGAGASELVSPHLARAEAQSIVIHDNQGNNARLACIDLAPQ